MQKERKPDDRFRPPGWDDAVSKIMETVEKSVLPEEGRDRLIGELFAEAMLDAIREIGVDAFIMPNRQIVLQVSKVIVPGKPQFIGTPMLAQGDYIGSGKLSFIQDGRASNLLVKLA